MANVGSIDKEADKSLVNRLVCSHDDDDDDDDDDDCPFSVCQKCPCIACLWHTCANPELIHKTCTRL